jgi:hypothetical protein
LLNLKREYLKMSDTPEAAITDARKLLKQHGEHDREARAALRAYFVRCLQVYELCATGHKAVADALDGVKVSANAGPREWCIAIVKATFPKEDRVKGNVRPQITKYSHVLTHALRGGLTSGTICTELLEKPGASISKIVEAETGARAQEAAVVEAQAAEAGLAALFSTDDKVTAPPNWRPVAAGDDPPELQTGYIVIQLNPDRAYSPEQMEAGKWRWVEKQGRTNAHWEFCIPKVPPAREAA